MAKTELNQFLKGILTSLALVPAFGSVAGRGRSYKTKSKNTAQPDKVGVDAGLRDVVAESFHGTNGRSSVVEELCTFSGRFSKMIDNPDSGKERFGIVETSQIVQTADKPLATSKVKLRLNYITREDGFLVLNSNDVQLKIHWSTLTKPSVASGISLLNRAKDDVRHVKKLVAFEGKYHDAGKLPSGKNTEDYITAVWELFWREHSWKELHKKAASTKKKKAVEREALEAIGQSVSTSDSDSDKVIVVDDNDDIVNIPVEFVTPPFKRTHSWVPPGWAVYIVFVYSGTRITDDYVHLYLGDAKSLDRSSAVSRTEERKKDMAEKKDQKLAKNASLTKRTPTSSAQSSEERLFQIDLASKRSKEQSKRALDAIAVLGQQKQDAARERDGAFNKCQMLCNLKDKEEREELPEWHEYKRMSVKVHEFERAMELAIQEQKRFYENDTFGTAAEEMLKEEMGGFKTKKQRTFSPGCAEVPLKVSIAQLQSLSPMSARTSELPSTQTSTTGRNLRDAQIQSPSPMSARTSELPSTQTSTTGRNLRDEYTSTANNLGYKQGRCGSATCQYPHLELRNEHKCKGCKVTILHTLCSANDDEENPLCSSCYDSSLL